MKTYKIDRGVLVDAETGLPTSPPPRSNMENVWRFWGYGQVHPNIEERFILTPGDFITSTFPIYGELTCGGETKPPEIKPIGNGGKSVFPLSRRKGEITTSFFPVSIMGEVELVAVSGYGPPCNTYRTPLALDTLEDAREWHAAGFSEKMDVAKWMKALDWRGRGAEDAARYIRFRYVALIRDKPFIIQDVPGIAFPVKAD